jgi:long-chain fatty acid transport protein
MKKTIKLALVAALALGATSAFATNGSVLIGTGAKSRGMGGVGIGVSHGAESALANPALITSVENTEISFGGTFFMPKVKNTNALVGMGAGGTDVSGSSESDADMNVIPSVSIASKVNDNFYFGLGMWGTAGMGVDYRGAGNTGQMSMVTNLQLMQFGVPLVYTANNFSVGITPLLQYGSLDINYILPGGMGGTAMGAGVAQDLQFGYNIGLAYEISDITIGAVYKSQVDMEYKGVLSTVVAPFTAGAGYNNDKLSTPAEIGIGISYTMKEHTIAFDYKNIQWSKAKGYEDFEWNDQNVYSLGYEYSTSDWSARLGYNYAQSPIEEQTSSTRNSANLDAGGINTFNLLGFPAIVTSHFSIGGTYNISEKTSVDLAYAYAPEVSETFKNFANQDITTKHSQTSLSLGLNYAF